MNKYEVLGIVGEGAYGVVLRCRNRVRYCFFGGLYLESVWRRGGRVVTWTAYLRSML